jgi:hypothetical protein
LLHFCNGAIAAAVDARHDRVTPEDIRKADREYSQFALDALRVENGITFREWDEVLTRFLGMSSTMSKEEAIRLIQEAGVGAERAESLLLHLRTLSFLGSETRPNEFVFADDPEEARRAEILSEHMSAERGGAERVQVHPAFRPYLEMVEDA